jgi:hypothetical protein
MTIDLPCLLDSIPSGPYHTNDSGYRLFVIEQCPSVVAILAMIQ